MSVTKKNFIHASKAVLFMLFLGMTSGVSAESLYNESLYKSLVMDHRGFKVGDILTVLIYEEASATSSAASGSDVGMAVAVNASSVNSDGAASLGASNEFDGGGTLARSGKLKASVSVSIKEVLNNGDYLINGDQQLIFNNETQFISVSGRVRSVDIRVDNSILSTKLAESKIEFTGEGLLSSAEKPGVITRFFNWLF